MKLVEVIVGPEADFDLSQIYRWVYEASRNPDVARRFLDRLLDRCRRIGDAPHGGRPRDDLEPGLRTVPFEHSAVIAYRVEADPRSITNVFYGGRDCEALYRGRDPASAARVIRNPVEHVGCDGGSHPPCGKDGIAGEAVSNRSDGHRITPGPVPDSAGIPRSR